LSLAAFVVCFQGLPCSFSSLRSSVPGTGSFLVRAPRWIPEEPRSSPQRRVQSDPVNNVSPEMAAAGRAYAQKYEDIFLAGQKLWAQMKKDDKVPKKIYFVGTNGNQGDMVAEAVMDALAYIAAPDGTKMIHRKPGIKYPKIVYRLVESDKELAKKSKIAPVDLYMDDEPEYRRLETEVLREFQNEDTEGHPAAMVVGESALDTPENIEIVKSGLVIWVAVDPEWSWDQIQARQKQGGGLYIPQISARPPVWCIANGWDGDVDDTEGKLEYTEILRHHFEKYESVANLRIRADVPGLAENSYWMAERIMKAMNEHFGFSSGEASVESEVLEKDLTTFLEGARLSKYIEPALEWCNEQGAASIEDIVENVPDFAEALGLKPLERKRLDKAAATVAATAAATA